MDISAFSVAKHLSSLVGRPVEVASVGLASFSRDTRVACYEVLPNGSTAVVQLDFHLLTELAGAMVVYPKAQIDEQIRTGTLDATLEDATCEVMNVLSAVVVAQGRAIFKGIFRQGADYSGAAQDLVCKAAFPLRLRVSLPGGKPGFMSIASECF